MGKSTNILDLNNRLEKLERAGGGGGSKDPGYSLNEINTGKKWIDGKSIYRKVFKIYENGELADGITVSGTDYEGGVPEDFDHIISFNIPSVRPGSEGYTDNMTGMGTAFSNNAVLRNDGKFYYNPGYNPVEAYCIMEYTKLTSEELEAKNERLTALAAEKKSTRKSSKKEV